MNKFKTYVISLEKDTHRRDWMNSIQPKIGLNFEFFNAVTPDEITQEIRNHFDHTDFHEWDINRDAVISTFMSHTKVLMEAAIHAGNILIIEDDIDIIREVDWTDIDFTQFDVLNLTGNDVSCFAYLVSLEGVHKILSILDSESLKITQAWDWELYKMADRINYKWVAEPVFIQLEGKFTSNIAPEGYRKKQSS